MVRDMFVPLNKTMSKNFKIWNQDLFVHTYPNIITYLKSEWDWHNTYEGTYNYPIRSHDENESF